MTTDITPADPFTPPAVQTTQTTQQPAQPTVTPPAPAQQQTNPTVVTAPAVHMQESAQNSNQQQNIDPVQTAMNDILLNLTGGNEVDVSQQQQQQPAQTQQQVIQQVVVDAQGNPITPPTPPSPTQEIINQYANPQAIQSAVHNVDTNAIIEGFQEQNLEPLLQAFATVAQQAVDESLTTMLKILPDFGKSLESTILQSTTGTLAADRTWSEFVQQYPDYAPYKDVVAPVIDTGLKGQNADKGAVFAAVSTLYSGLLQSNPLAAQNTNQQDNQEADKTIVLMDFLQQ